MRFKINIYDIDTECFVASVGLNDVISRRIKSTLDNARGEWDAVGEYPLNELIESHIVSISFFTFSPYDYHYFLEKVEE